eukprot:5290300-Pyramimonas_sp.AAC.1
MAEVLRIENQPFPTVTPSPCILSDPAAIDCTSPPSPPRETMGDLATAQRPPCDAEAHAPVPPE